MWSPRSLHHDAASTAAIPDVPAAAAAAAAAASRATATSRRAATAAPGPTPWPRRAPPCHAADPPTTPRPSTPPPKHHDLTAPPHVRCRCAADGRRAAAAGRAYAQRSGDQGKPVPKAGVKAERL